MERRWVRINKNDFKKGFQLHKLHKDSQILGRCRNVQLGAWPSNLHGGKFIYLVIFHNLYVCTLALAGKSWQDPNFEPNFFEKFI